MITFSNSSAWRLQAEKNIKKSHFCIQSFYFQKNVVFDNNEIADFNHFNYFDKTNFNYFEKKVSNGIEMISKKK